MQFIGGTNFKDNLIFPIRLGEGEKSSIFLIFSFFNLLDIREADKQQ